MYPNTKQVREYAKEHGIELIGRFHRREEWEYEEYNYWDGTKYIKKKRYIYPHTRIYTDSKEGTPNEIYLSENGAICICGEDENGFCFCT